MQKRIKDLRELQECFPCLSRRAKVIEQAIRELSMNQENNGVFQKRLMLHMPEREQEFQAVHSGTFDHHSISVISHWTTPNHHVSTNQSGHLAFHEQRKNGNFCCCQNFRPYCKEDSRCTSCLRSKQEQSEQTRQDRNPLQSALQYQHSRMSAPGNLVAICFVETPSLHFGPDTYLTVQTFPQSFVPSISVDGPNLASESQNYNPLDIIGL